MTGHCKGNYQNKPNDVDPGARLLRVAINSEIKHKVPNLQDPAYKREQQSLTFNYTVKELTVEQLLYEEIAKRHNFTAVFWNKDRKCFHRSGKYFVSSDLLVFDFDNSTYVDDPTDPEKKRKTKVKYDDLRYWTIERALAHPFIKKYAALLYTTNSHTEEWHKFRVGFITPETITKRDTYQMFLRAGIQLFDADPQCKDAARFFYGAGPDAQVILLGNVMTPEAIELLKNNYEVSKQANEKTQGQAARDEARKEQPPVTIKPEERSKLARWYGARVIETARKMINESVYKVNRHECRLKASILLGGYVAGGILPYEEAYNALAEVVSANTDNFEGAMQTVRDGLEYGQAEPITLERLEAESAEHRAAYFGSKQQASQEITPEQETIDPEVCRAAFRLLKQQATEQEEKTAYDRRRSTAGDFAAVSVLLSEHEFKDKARVAVQAFMGLCASKNNYNEFEFGYSELYPLLRRYDPDLFQRTDGKLNQKLRGWYTR